MRSLDDDLALRALVHLGLLAAKHAETRHAPGVACHGDGRADRSRSGRSVDLEMLLKADLLLQFDDLLSQSVGGVGLLLEELFHAGSLRLEQLTEGQLIGSA